MTTIPAMPSAQIAALLKDLERNGIQLWVEGDQLRFRGRPGALTDDLRGRIGTLRAALIEHLRSEAAGAARPIELVRVSREGDHPLSHNQQRLWFMKQVDPNSAAYNIPSVVRVRGMLDVATLETSLASIIQRQESLRTRFISIDGTPRCIVEPRAQLSIEIIDLTSLPQARREAEAQAEIERLLHEPIDLAKCPAMRMRLVRVAVDDQFLVCVVDHIVADGLSIGIIIAEWLHFYLQCASGEERSLPPLEFQYLDYADWQRRRADAGALAEGLNYWKQRLAGLAPALQLPTDRPRPPVQTSAGARIHTELTRDEVAGLKALARGEGTTLFTVLISAFQALLHRYTAETDIPVGTAVANRGREALSSVIGFFANNVVMRGDFAGNPTVREAIARAREMVVQGFAHEDTPFDVLVDALAPRRALDHSPLFQVMFVLQSFPASKQQLPGLDFEVVEPALHAARFDLSVDAIDRGGVMTLYFEYNTDLFERQTVARMLQHYRAMLAGYVAAPALPVSGIELLDAAELRQLAIEWNRTQMPLEEPLTLHGLFEAQAAKTPDAIAVRFEDQSLTYAQLDARANRLAHHLVALKPGGDRLIGVWMERGPDMVVALLGVLKSGCAYVPLDPGFPHDRIAFMAEDAGLDVVVTQDSLVESLPAQNVRTVCLDKDRAVLDRLPATRPGVAVRPDDLAYVIYTSGSTGKPKGVQLQHHGVVNFMRSMHKEPGIGPGDRLVGVTTLSFDIAGLEIHGPLTCGGTVILASRDTALDGAALAQLLEQHDATILQATPATWRLLLESGWAGKKGLRMLCGGEALPRELATRLLAAGGELWNLYGPTETTIWSTLTRVTDASRPISIGKPIANTTIYVLEPSGSVAPVGVPGELCIGGVGVARGYRNRPELTAEKFVELAIAGRPPERVYRTGDLARWRADGQLEFVGRRDHQVKIRGFRIELGEIETVLARHEAIRQAVVVAREATPGDPRLVAYLVYRPDEDLTVSEVRRYLRGELPEYMVPSLVVTLDAIPLTPNGKVDRAALPDPFRDSAARVTEYEPPEPGLEQLMARIWGEVLKIERVGAQDNFFELGGHSLLSLRVAAAVEKESGWRMDPRLLFFQTLRQVAISARAAGVSLQRA
jgi:amino acid adenylation domain-containing protein